MNPWRFNIRERLEKDRAKIVREVKENLGHLLTLCTGAAAA